MRGQDKELSPWVSAERRMAPYLLQRDVHPRVEQEVSELTIPELMGWRVCCRCKVLLAPEVAPGAWERS